MSDEYEKNYMTDASDTRWVKLAYANLRMAQSDQRITDLERRNGEMEKRLAHALQYEYWSDNDGDSWLESPDDADFVHGRELGEEFTLLASPGGTQHVTYRVTKVPDDTDDDYEVEEVQALTRTKEQK